MHTLKIAAVGDCELEMTRTFDAPRHLVFAAYTQPDLLKRWLLGPPGWTLPVCEVDLRVGGAYRYVWRNEARGIDMGAGGVYREIVPPERIVQTESFDQPWYEGEAINTVTFIEAGGQTEMRSVMRYSSRETRDAVLRSPMESGVKASYDRLADVLSSLQPVGGAA
jgi:uncharacterized protein YndB with AHSA1/START domain